MSLDNGFGGVIQINTVPGCEMEAKSSGLFFFPLFLFFFCLCAWGYQGISSAAAGPIWCRSKQHRRAADPYCSCPVTILFLKVQHSSRPHLIASGIRTRYSQRYANSKYTVILPLKADLEFIIYLLLISSVPR